jgi:hypothetical protein
MLVRKALICLSALLVSSLSVMSRAVGQSPAESVSLIRLVANPDQYEGKLVQVTGFVRFEFEGTAIYLHREDFEKHIPANGLWLNLSKCGSLSGEAITIGYALVEGKFTGKRRGHMGLLSGELYDIRRCEKAPWQ